RRDRLGEAWPAAACVILRVALEEGIATRPTPIDAVLFGIHVLAGEGSLGPRLPEHGVLGRGEPLAPLLLAARERLQTVIGTAGDGRHWAAHAGPGQPAVAMGHL